MSKSFDFDPKINCFVGNNGVGKTNVLDAIYHLSFGKSYFNPITSQNIHHGTDFFVVDGHYEKENREEKVIISAKKGQKKVIKRNGKLYERFDTIAHCKFLKCLDQKCYLQQSILAMHYADLKLVNMLIGLINILCHFVR